MKAVSAAIFAAGALAAPAGAATLGTAATAYSLGNEGKTLVTVATSFDGAPAGLDLQFEGGADVSLDAVAFRPRTTQLYGYDDDGDTVYEIDTATGATRAVASGGSTSTADLGFDFNNVLDAARIVTAEDENRVFFPDDAPPNIVSVTDLFYVDGDANQGADPNVVMNAYTNAVPFPEETAQYVIDSDLDVLATLGNNAGTLETVGELWLDGAAFDVGAEGGFDILSFAEGDNSAFALLSGETGQGIYALPLEADGAGRVNLSLVTETTADFGTLDGFAVAPVPLPAPAAMLLAALGAMGFGLRRRG